MTSHHARIAHSLIAAGAGVLLMMSPAEAGGRNEARLPGESGDVLIDPAVLASGGRNLQPRATALHPPAPFINTCQQTSGRNAIRGAEIIAAAGCANGPLAN